MGPIQWGGAGLRTQRDLTVKTVDHRYCIHQDAGQKETFWRTFGVRLIVPWYGEESTRDVST